MANPSIILRGAPSGPTFDGSTPGYVLTIQADGKSVRPEPCGAVGSGLTSFNGRTNPAVVPTAGDYAASQITNDSSVPGSTTAEALDALLLAANSAFIQVPEPLPGTSEPALQYNTQIINAAFAEATAMHGAVTVRLFRGGQYHVNGELVCDALQGVIFDGGAGLSQNGQGAAIYQHMVSMAPAGYDAFAQPAVNSAVTVTVTGTAGMSPGQILLLRQQVTTVSLAYYRVASVLSPTSVSLINMGSTGNQAPGATVGVGFLFSSDAVVQMRSGFGCFVRGISFIMVSPQFTGRAVNFDGAAFGSDCGTCKTEHCNWRTDFFTALPVLVPQSSAQPSVSLSGTNAHCLSLIIEITSSGGLGVGAFKYSTDGGKTWDERSKVAPITLAATHAAPATSTATGLTFNFANVAYVAGQRWTALQGLQRGMSVYAGFDCVSEDCKGALVLESTYLSGVNNHVVNIAGQAIDGYSVVLDGCGGARVQGDGEPGGVGVGRGGVYAVNGNDNRIDWEAGDEMGAGAWVHLINEHAAQVDGVFSTSSVVSPFGNSAVHLDGSVGSLISGSFFCPHVFDVIDSSSTTVGVTVSNVPGFTWDGISNNLFEGTNVAFVDMVFAAGTSTITNFVGLANCRANFGFQAGPFAAALLPNSYCIGGLNAGLVPAWGGTSAAFTELLNVVFRFGRGVGHYSQQNVPDAGHAFVVRQPNSEAGQYTRLYPYQDGQMLYGDGSSARTHTLARWDRSSVALDVALAATATLLAVDTNTAELPGQQLSTCFYVEATFCAFDAVNGAVATKVSRTFKKAADGTLTALGAGAAVISALAGDAALTSSVAILDASGTQIRARITSSAAARWVAHVAISTSEFTY